MKKNIFLTISTILSLSSCMFKTTTRFKEYRCNTWHDLNVKENNYHDCKVNLSLYLNQNYFVLGVILGENESFTLHIYFYTEDISDYTNSNETNYLDFDKIIYTDSTGAKVNFNGPVGYTFNSSRTIKYDYSNWDEETINIFNNSYQYTFEFFYDSFTYNKSNKGEDDNKVDFGDDLSKVKI